MTEAIDELEEVIAPASDVREAFRRFWMQATALVDGGVAFKLTLSPVKLTRSVRQNALLWALLTDIANQVDWYGQRLDKQDWKEVISASWREQRAVPKIGGGGFVVLGVRTSKLSVREMAELLDVIQAFGGEHGVRWTAPKWMWEGA